MKTIRFAVSFAIVLLAAACVNAQNVVIQWNGIAATTIVTNGKEASVASGAWFAYVHLAVFDAVNSIDHRFQPYAFTTQAPEGASKDAAAVAAAHRILVQYFPAQQSSLDLQFTTSLAGIADTGANIASGVAIGEAAAQTLIDARAGDGLLANVALRIADGGRGGVTHGQTMPLIKAAGDGHDPSKIRVNKACPKHLDG